MNNLSFATLGLRSGEYGDFEVSSHSLVLVDMVDELTSAEELLDLFRGVSDVTVVASATTELNPHQVVCFGVTLDLAWLRLHYYFLLNIL